MSFLTLQLLITTTAILLSVYKLLLLATAYTPVVRLLLYYTIIASFLTLFNCCSVVCPYVATAIDPAATLCLSIRCFCNSNHCYSLSVNMLLLPLLLSYLSICCYCNSSHCYSPVCLFTATETTRL
jgi:hypothetical protein